MSPLPQFHRVVASAVFCLGLVLLDNSLLAPHALAVDPAFVDSGQRLGQESSTAVALGDLNGDGSLDAFVGNSQGQVDQVWLNDGRGAFTDTRQPLTTDDTRAVALGDLNGDGSMDAFVVTGSAQPDQVWLNDGQGNFSDSGQRLGAAAGMAVALADFNGDGSLDAYVTNGGAADSASLTFDSDQLWLNDGRGRFAQSPLPFPRGSSQAVAAGDVSGDGKLDLLAASGRWQGYADRLWYGDGKGKLTNGGALPGNAPGNGIALADFNGDGWLDAFVANGSPANRRKNTVWFNDKTGRLGSPLLLGPDNNLGAAVALGDVDGDGKPDAYVATGPLDNDQLWLNSGAGTFTLENIPAPYAATAVALGDLNGDGSLDAFIANGQDQPNQVLFNTHAARFAATNQPLAAGTGLDAALADLNGDGRLDVVTVGQTPEDSHVYCNSGNGDFFSSVLPFTATIGQAVALGDLNGDGRIDIYIGGVGGSGDQVWLNHNPDHGGDCDAFVDSGQRLDMPDAKHVALGDLNGDGAIDAFVVNGSMSPALALLNDGSGQLVDTGQQLGLANGSGVALGDVNGDGSLDAVVANARGPRASRVYLNDGAGNFTDSGQSLAGADARGVALGDLNGDGALDAIFANGAGGQPSRVFVNDGSGVFTDSGQRLGADACYGAALADLNGDGALDAVLGCAAGAAVWWNDGKGNLRSDPNLLPATNSIAVATGDLNGDGYADIVTVNNSFAGAGAEDSTANGGGGQQPGAVWLNRSAPGHALQLTVQTPGMTPAVGLGATAEQLDRLALPITYTLTGTLASQVHSLELSYSLDGGGQWRPAAITGGDAPVVGRPGALVWDTAASNLFGASDNVVLRLAARFAHAPAAAGSYGYTGTVAGPVLWPQVATVTTPVRVRGTQVRVVDDSGQPVAGAVVFRRSGADNPVAAVMADSAGQPFVTDANGYLRGRGVLLAGDELAALAPLSSTFAYSAWAMSAPPTANGVRFATVPQPAAETSGVQTLTVAAKNPLLLFDLDIALEWDASNDGDFLDRLRTAIGRTSAVLFQVTDGQVALGNVTVHQAKENWSNANVVLYASNSIHPRATMGGVVLQPVDDISGTQVITAAYIPGQIRMGPLWDPFGQNQTDLQQDWWRAFAHELAHYLLFQSDDYIGVRNGVLTSTNCQGSIMTNAYDQENYGGLLTRDQWVGDCLDTLAYKLLTGRTDWETITHFLPMLSAPSSVLERTSPSTLPLAVTKVTVLPPPTSTVSTGAMNSSAGTLPARPYDLRDEKGNLATLRQATGYLYQMGLSAGLEAPVQGIVALGSTGSGRDSMVVRGARPGDRVCIFDTQHDPPRLGCTWATGQNPTVQVRLLSGWSPQIDVAAITSSTLAVTVTQVVTQGTLAAQVVPAYGANGPGVSVAVAMTNANSADPSVWTGVAQLAEPSFEGYVRVWQSGIHVTPPHEAVTQYFLSAGWGADVHSAGVAAAQAFGPNTRIGGVDARTFGPNTRIGGVDARAFGPNTRTGGVDVRTFGPNTRIGGVDVRAFGANRRTLEAPVASGDGRVTIFDLDDPLRAVDPMALQSIDTLPHLPAWLTPVGKGYRLASTEGYTRTIAFHYVQRDVPEGYEYALGVYFLPAGQAKWQSLDTQLDQVDNMASAQMPVDSTGTYALMATVPMPAMHPGWNFLAYTIPETRTVSLALDSAGDAYTVLYSYDPEATPAWRMYDAELARSDPAVASLVNTLDALEFGHSYLLYATRVITPYLAVPGPRPAQAATAEGSEAAPALPSAAYATAARATTLASGPTLDVAPATFYGFVTGNAAPALEAGQTVTATIGGVECGAATLAGQGDRLFYAMQVAAAAQTPGCGSEGAIVQFTIAGVKVGEALWYNTQANAADLVTDTAQ